MLSVEPGRGVSKARRRRTKARRQEGLRPLSSRVPRMTGILLHVRQAPNFRHPGLGRIHLVHHPHCKATRQRSWGCAPLVCGNGRADPTRRSECGRGILGVPWWSESSRFANPAGRWDTFRHLPCKGQAPRQCRPRPQRPLFSRSPSRRLRQQRIEASPQLQTPA